LSGEALPRLLEVCTVAMLGLMSTTSTPSSFSALIACEHVVRKEIGGKGWVVSQEACEPGVGGKGGETEVCR
jgi:hypothetical protein